MKIILFISVLFLCSCITITKNYYSKEIVKETVPCNHKCESPLWRFQNAPMYDNMPTFPVYTGSINLTPRGLLLQPQYYENR